MKSSAAASLLLLLSIAPVARAEDAAPDASPAATPSPDTTPAATPTAVPPAVRTTDAPLQQRLETMSLEELLNLKISSVTKFAQTTKDAPSVVSIATRDRIRDYGWTTLNDILYLQPGFTPGQDYERPTVVARGLFESWNNNHLLLLIDGVPYNDTETGGAYSWEITPLFLAKSVETIRGPGSALYGSSAMNGVIQVNSIDAPEHAGGHFRVRTGDFATRAYDAVAGGTSRMIAAVVGYETFETNGNEYRSFDASGRTNPNGSLAQFTTKDQRAHSYFFAKLEGRESLEGLSLQIHDQRWQYETGHGWFFQIPDVGESMREAREIGTLRYKRSVFEVVAQAQRHYLHHDMRFAPNGAYGGFYPAGVTEFLETHVDSGFSRVQANVKAPRGAVVLGGIEQSLFYYGGDDKHYANARLSDAAGGYPPTPNNAFEPLGPYYEYVLNRPVSTSSAFAQITSGEWLGDHAELTLGARYDNLWFNYDDVAAAGKPEKWKSYQQLSPRAGLVVKATDSLTFKALAGRAFRAPAPVELFGANTFALASNINALKPEYVTTYELAADAKVSRGLSWRTNVFYTELENQIAYGGQNLLTNIYSHTNAGVESEVLYEVEAGPIRVDGFANVSDVRLLHEKVQDPSISLENHRVTWAASDSAKAGIRAGRGAWVFATSALWQGPANRRASDRATPVNDAARPSKIDAWTRIDANVAWEPADWGRLAIKVTNLTDERARIIKNGDFPFDYRAAGRRVMATFEMNL